jgi:esterase/lipase
MDKKKIIKLSDYEDFVIPDNFNDKKFIKNLLELSVKNNIEILDKKNCIKNKNNIIKNCENIKKKKLKEFTRKLNNNKNKNIVSLDLKKNNDEFIENIESIDSIINIVKTHDSEIDNLNNELKNNKKFIDMFSN